MKRASNWPTIFAAFIERKRSEPFAWGSNDCCLFASDWVLDATGIDPAQSFRGKYSTALGAARFLKANGGVRGIIKSVGEPLGMTAVDGARCQRGDLVIAETGSGEGIGICIGSHAAFVSKDGLRFIPIDFQRAAHCWRI